MKLTLSLRVRQDPFKDFKLEFHVARQGWIKINWKMKVSEKILYKLFQQFDETGGAGGKTGTSDQDEDGEKFVRFATN